MIKSVSGRRGPSCISLHNARPFCAATRNGIRCIHIANFNSISIFMLQTRLKSFFLNEFWPQASWCMTYGVLLFVFITCLLNFFFSLQITINIYWLLHTMLVELWEILIIDTVETICLRRWVIVKIDTCASFVFVVNWTWAKLLTWRISDP